MSDAIAEFLRRHLNDRNGVIWPSEDTARIDLAQTLLGIGGVSTCDYWYNFGRDLVVNSQPAKQHVREWSDLAKKDREYRRVFATLNDEQRQSMLRLLRQVINGTMYSALVELDQFPHANVIVQLVNREDDDVVFTVQALPGGQGLHDRWHQWVTEFSDSPRDE